MRYCLLGPQAVGWPNLNTHAWFQGSDSALDRHSHQNHCLLAGRFQQPAETTNRVPANHQTAKYANSANESESCLSLRSSRPSG